jgi:peptidyl-dipeptidase Dcp
VLADTHEFFLHLTSASDLEGLPPSAVEAAAEEAQSRNLEGWVFTLDMPSYLPFITYSERRDLREKMFKGSGSRGHRTNAHNNTDLIYKMVRLRQDRAVLLGFASHADYVLQERMAKSAEEVQQFLTTLRDAAAAPAQREFAALQDFAKPLGLQEVQRWDSSFLIEKMKKERFQLDDEVLKPYFQLEAVVAGMFEVAQKLYGLQFQLRTDIPLYHKDVVTYEVLDADQRHLAVFYTDFFPRKGKRNGAWMTSYRSQKVRNGVEERPHVSIVCNFTKPTATKPSLLTFQEVTTLFHEFGHALHGILAEGAYGSITGTSVYWDFVELPSQIMENWCYEKACLDLFAKHYQTGAALPHELVLKIRESAAFMEGLATLRQIGLARLDLAWHSGQVDASLGIEAFERMVLKDTDIFPAVPGVAISPAFSHIFQGSYAAGYYSYKWAEVLDADAFERFLEVGIFNPEVGQAFRALLAAGGSEHPMELYKRFRGQEPDPKALLRRAGLIAG